MYAKGIGAHAPSRIVVSLAGRCETFAATVGLHDGRTGSVAFRVLADGEDVASTPVMTGGSAPVDLVADVTGADRLALVVTDGGNGNGSDHADWADARVAC